MMAKGSLRTLVTQSDAIRYLQQKKQNNNEGMHSVFQFVIM